MRTSIEKPAILISIILVSIAIFLTYILSYYNRKLVLDRIEMRAETEEIIHKSENILTIVLQGVDNSIRAYLITKSDAHKENYRITKNLKGKVFEDAKNLLVKQYAVLDEETDKKILDSLIAELHEVKIATDEYLLFCDYMMELASKDSSDKVKELLNEDRGMVTVIKWHKYSKRIAKFESKIGGQAQDDYQLAIRQNTIIQTFLLIFGLPTLFFAGYKIDQAFRLNDIIMKVEAENVRIIKDQNEVLERKVKERTEEITQQNTEIGHLNRELISLNEELVQQQEEIAAQRDTLIDRNTEIHEAHELIERQNKQITLRNEYLESIVAERTKDLMSANNELVDYNHQLEQFAFITAHNLRAPVARILGLGTVLGLHDLPPDEKNFIVQKMIVSSGELDSVIKDLNLILDIKKNNVNTLSTISLSDTIEKVKKMAEKEIESNTAEIITDFSEVETIYSLVPYIDSVLYNLIGNSIKYRHPDRNPHIQIKSTKLENYICLKVSDNGLGIDLKHYKDKIFNLYKRFHTHVEGKGLGLYLVKSQITSLGGKIEVYSELDKGTTFMIYLKNNES